MHDPKHYEHLSQFLLATARRTPEATALCGREGTMSYAELAGAADTLALRLNAEGIGCGDRVFVLIGNSFAFAFAFAFWAVQFAGAIAVPLAPQTPEERLDWLIADGTPAMILTERPLSASGVPQLLADLDRPGHFACLPMTGCQRRSPEAQGELGVMIYTSGSSGRPKAVMLSQKNLITAACSVATYLGYRADDSIFCAIPFSFDYGLHQLTMAALCGAAVVVERDFTRPFFSLAWLARSGATVLPVVPTMAMLVQQIGGRFDLSGLRIVTNTAAALGETMIDGLRALMPAAELFSMYGLTECHRCTYLDPAELDRRKSSIGKAIPFTRMWVVDECGQARSHSAQGELVIAGATIMQGYWQNPEATARRLRRNPETGEINLYTGDICRLDAEGFCYFLDRADEIVKVRGRKVVPAEIERCLQRHPGIALTAVLGQPDPQYGTALTAVVELHLGAELTLAELRAFAERHLELHERPLGYQLETRLPRSANGKIDKGAIRLKAPALL